MEELHAKTDEILLTAATQSAVIYRVSFDILFGAKEPASLAIKDLDFKKTRRLRCRTCGLQSVTQKWRCGERKH